MIFGTVRLEDGAVTTHRDSYLIDTLTVVSVRRPVLAPALLTGGGLAAFTVSFAGLLYPGELATISAASLTVLLTGWQLGQLKLLSRDLRGSELSGAVFGRYADLNRIRREIAKAIKNRNEGVNT